MDGGLFQPSPPDPKLIEDVVNRLKSQGVFDNLRKECLADVDTKPAYQNLTQRVESYVAKFLEEQKWSPDLNKNQLRDGLRKQINQSGMLASGVDRVIDQVVQPKIYKVFKPEIDKVMCEVLGLDPKQREENEKKRQDLLVKYQQQQSFLQKNAQKIQQQGFQQQQFFQGTAGAIRPQGVPNTNFPPPMLPPQRFNQFQNQQGMQTIQTPRGPVPLMQVNTLAAQQGYMNMPQNYNQANMQQYQAANLLIAQQQALVRAGLQSMGMAVPQQNMMQPGIMQQAGVPGVPGVPNMNQLITNAQLALATSKAQQIALQTSQVQKLALQTSQAQPQQTSQTQFGLPRPLISAAFTLPTTGTTLSSFSPMTTSSPRAPKTPVSFSGGMTPGTPVTTAGMTPGTPSQTAAGSPCPSPSPALPTSPPLPPLPDTDIKTEKPRTPEPKSQKDLTKSKEKLEKKSSSLQLPFAVKEKSKHVKEGSVSRDSPKLEKMKRLKEGSSSRSSPSLDKVKREESSRESSPKLKHIREGSSSRDSPKSDSLKMKSKLDKYKDSSREPLRSDKLGHEIKLKKEELKQPMSEKMRQKEKEERLRILGEKVERKLQQKQESRDKYKEKEKLTSGKVKIGNRILGPKVPSVVPLPAEGKIIIGERVLGPKIPLEKEGKMKSMSDRDRLKFIEKQKVSSGDKLYSTAAERLKESERNLLGERSLEKHKIGEKYKSKSKHGEKIKEEFLDRSKMSGLERKGEKPRLPGEKRKSYDADCVKTSGSIKTVDMFNKPSFKKTKPVTDIKRERADSEPKRPKEIPLETVRPREDPRLKDIYWGREEEHISQKERYVEGHRADPRSASKERRKTMEGSERSKHSSKELHGERRKNVDSPDFLERKHSKPPKDSHEKKRKSSKKPEKVPEKKYEFAWNKIKSDQLSDVSVSSVHTSDLSSFEYDMSDFETDAKELNKRKKEAGLPIKQEPSTSKEPKLPSQPLGDDYEPLSESEDEGVYKEEPAAPKLAKNANSQREKDRQRRRAEIEAKLRELDERKHQLQEECRKLKQVEKANVKEGKEKEEYTDRKEDSAEAKRPVPQSPLKKTKQELKQHLREQKVFEKKMALRRQRAPNKRYTSEEFTSIFSEGQKFYKESRRGDLLSTTTSDSSRSRSATPTQDEQHYLPRGKAIAKTEQNIPIYEVTTPQKGRQGNLGRFFSGESSSPVVPLSLKDDDYYETISSGDSILGSPNSEISEAKSDDFLDDSPGKPEKKHKSASPLDSEQKRNKSHPEAPIEAVEKPISKTPPLSAARNTASRYDMSDLYKPRTSHRRGSPIRTPAEDIPAVKGVAQIKEEKAHKEKKKVEKYSPPKSDAAKQQKRYEDGDLFKPRLTFLSSGRRRNVSGRSLSSKGSPDIVSAPEKELIEAVRVFTSKRLPDKQKGKKRPRSMSPLSWTNCLLARPSIVKKQAGKARPRKRAKLAPPSREDTPEPTGRVIRQREASPSLSISRPSTPELTIDEQAESVAGSIDSRPSTPGFRPKSPPGEPPAGEDEAPAPVQVKGRARAIKMSDVAALLRQEEAELAAIADQGDAGVSSPRSDVPTPTMDEPAAISCVVEEMDVDQPASDGRPSPSDMKDSSSNQIEHTYPVPGADVVTMGIEGELGAEASPKCDNYMNTHPYSEPEPTSMEELAQTASTEPLECDAKLSIREEKQIESEGTFIEPVDTDKEVLLSVQATPKENVTETEITETETERHEASGANDSYETPSLEEESYAVGEDTCALDDCPSALDILATSALSAAAFTDLGEAPTPHVEERAPSPDSLGITLVDVSGQTEFCTFGDEPKTRIAFSDEKRSDYQQTPIQTDSAKSADEDVVNERPPSAHKSLSPPPTPSPSKDKESIMYSASEENVRSSSPSQEEMENSDSSGSDSPDAGMASAAGDLQDGKVTSDKVESRTEETAPKVRHVTYKEDARSLSGREEVEEFSLPDDVLAEFQGAMKRVDSPWLREENKDGTNSSVLEDENVEEVDGADKEALSTEAVDVALELNQKSLAMASGPLEGVLKGLKPMHAGLQTDHGQIEMEMSSEPEVKSMQPDENAADMEPESLKIDDGPLETEQELSDLEQIPMHSQQETMETVRGTIETEESLEPEVKSVHTEEDNDKTEPESWEREQELEKLSVLSQETTETVHGTGETEESLEPEERSVHTEETDKTEPESFIKTKLEAEQEVSVHSQQETMETVQGTREAEESLEPEEKSLHTEEEIGITEPESLKPELETELEPLEMGQKPKHTEQSIEEIEPLETEESSEPKPEQTHPSKALLKTQQSSGESEEEFLEPIKQETSDMVEEEPNETSLDTEKNALKLELAEEVEATQPVEEDEDSPDASVVDSACKNHEEQLQQQTVESQAPAEDVPTPSTSPLPGKCPSPTVTESAVSEELLVSPSEPEVQSEKSQEEVAPVPDLGKSRRSSRASVTSEDAATSQRSVSPARSESPAVRKSRRHSRVSVASEDLTASPTRSESPAIQSRPGTPTVVPHVGPLTPPVGGRSNSPSSSRTSTPTSETRRTSRGKRSDSQSDSSLSTPLAPRVRRASSPTVKRTSLRSYSPPPHYGTRRAGKGKADKPEKRTPGAPAKKPKLTPPTISPPARVVRGQKPSTVVAPPRGRGKATAAAQSTSKTATGKRATRGSKDEGPPSKRGRH
ncbi:microtubule-associated protein futsch-like [Lineus longissimus]|uniref:microtubule-associated protein futsch-like n=1 Tax=Lineus longissimus TaxID=88925 RepID=UPI00315C6FF9